MIRLIATAGLFAIAAMAAPQERPAFEVASVKVTPPASAGLTNISPYGTGRFTATSITMELLISLAYGVSDSQIVGLPGKIASERYDVTAKAEPGVSLTYEELNPRLQQLLEHRFKLTVHREMKDTQGYALVVAKSGPKLKKASAGAESRGMILPRGLRNPNASLDTLAGMLARPLHRPVVNKTGIEGNYNIVLNYAQEGATDSSLPSIFTALQEQMGLKLEPLMVPTEMLVIDHVESVPIEN
jgi:uncharacterized protein (TIGR03435 family)